VGLTRTITLAVAPGAMERRLQDTVPPEPAAGLVHVPWLFDNETKVVVGGSGIERVTPYAVLALAAELATKVPRYVCGKSTKNPKNLFGPFLTDHQRGFVVLWGGLQDRRP
jgi:hypothetical protein